MRAESITGRSLEIGSGYHPVEGFTHRCDINPHATNSDACVPCDRLPWEDGWFDDVRACDVLEHTSHRHTRRVLAEWRRVLRPGGHIYIQVPDAETAMRRWVDDPTVFADRPHGHDNDPSITHLAWVLLGGHEDPTHTREGDDWRWDAHFSIFSESAMREFLCDAGFERIEIIINPHPNLLVDAWKPA